MSVFGLARIKEEGAPIHPDDLEWECDIDVCAACRRRYDEQLERWRQHEIARGRDPDAS